jgi:hypothetical protein
MHTWIGSGCRFFSAVRNTSSWSSSSWPPLLSSVSNGHTAQRVLDALFCPGATHALSNGINQITAVYAPSIAAAAAGASGADGAPETGSYQTLRIDSATPKSEYDWFVLNALRGVCDAILTTGRILRCEPTVSMHPHAPFDAAFRDLRVSGLRRPYRAGWYVLSDGVELSFQHPVFSRKFDNTQLPNRGNEPDVTLFCGHDYSDALLKASQTIAAAASTSSPRIAVGGGGLEWRVYSLPLAVAQRSQAVIAQTHDLTWNDIPDNARVRIVSCIAPSVRSLLHFIRSEGVRSIGIEAGPHTMIPYYTAAAALDSNERVMVDHLLMSVYSASVAPGVVLDWRTQRPIVLSPRVLECLFALKCESPRIDSWRFRMYSRIE